MTTSQNVAFGSYAIIERCLKPNANISHKIFFKSDRLMSNEHLKHGYL